MLICEGPDLNKEKKVFKNLQKIIFNSSKKQLTKNQISMKNKSKE